MSFITAICLIFIQRLLQFGFTHLIWFIILFPNRKSLFILFTISSLDLHIESSVSRYFMNEFSGKKEENSKSYIKIIFNSSNDCQEPKQMGVDNEEASLGNLESMIKLSCILTSGEQHQFYVLNFSLKIMGLCPSKSSVLRTSK